MDGSSQDFDALDGVLVENPPARQKDDVDCRFHCNQLLAMPTSNRSSCLAPVISGLSLPCLLATTCLYHISLHLEYVAGRTLSGHKSNPIQEELPAICGEHLLLVCFTLQVYIPGHANPHLSLTNLLKPFF